MDTRRTHVSAASALCLLSFALAPACRTAMQANRRGGQDGGDDLGQDSRPSPTDAYPCQGIPVPDVRCHDGTPSYVCVENDGVSSWRLTCPEGPRDAGPPDTGHDCSAIASYLAAQMQPMGGVCTAVVRVDYTSLAILSHAFVCGSGTLVDEAAARQSATAAAVFPYTSGAGTGRLATAPNPTNQWVFYTAPADFGGVATVSALSGLATFAATVVRSGTGEILYPKTFDSADLGQGCTRSSSPSFLGIDLTGGEAQPRFAEVVTLVRSTALPDAFRRWGEIVSTVVLVYPRTVGAFVPSTAEYIVLLDGHWLL